MSSQVECPNCRHRMLFAEWKVCRQDYGCPNCGASLLSFRDVDEEPLASVTDILELTAQNDIRHLLYWKSASEFFIECSDVFAWGISDLEPLRTQKDFELLTQCLEQAPGEEGAILYCCKKRKMRPQGAYYGEISWQNWKLFDECGPDRPTNPGNPFDKGTFNRIVEDSDDETTEESQG